MTLLSTLITTYNHGDVLNQLDFILQSLYRFHRFSLQWDPSITDMTLTWPKDVTKVCYMRSQY